MLLEKTDENGLMYENATVNPKAFALLFEFDGDINAVKHVLYNCKATRPSISSQTKEETIEPQTESISITATPRPDGLVKGRCADSTATAFSEWYEQVILPDAQLSV